jgi:hypothetical protein
VAALAYAALFLTVGTLVQKRAMVSAFLYAFFIEGILSTLPATINQLTISFRLRSMLVQLLDLNPSTARELERFFDTSTSVPMHLLCLSVLVALMIVITMGTDFSAAETDKRIAEQGGMETVTKIK